MLKGKKKMKNEELIVLLRYAYEMTRIIAPINARKVGLNNIGNGVMDFYKYIVVDLQKGNEIDIEHDEFLKDVFEAMKEDLDDRDIEYDGWFSLKQNNEESKQEEEIEKDI